MSGSPTAYINDRGELVDPHAVAIIAAVEQHACREMLKTLHAERVAHFARRIAELGRDPSEVVIVVLNVDDPVGGLLAAALMPGHDWDAIRAQGQVPFARGLATREPLQEMLDAAEPDAGAALRAISGVAVVMMDRGVVICEAVSP